MARGYQSIEEPPAGPPAAPFSNRRTAHGIGGWGMGLLANKHALVVLVSAGLLIATIAGVATSHNNKQGRQSPVLGADNYMLRGRDGFAGTSVGARGGTGERNEEDDYRHGKPVGEWNEEDDYKAQRAGSSRAGGTREVNEEDRYKDQKKNEEDTSLEINEEDRYKDQRAHKDGASREINEEDRYKDQKKNEEDTSLEINEEDRYKDQRAHKDGASREINEEDRYKDQKKNEEDTSLEINEEDRYRRAKAGSKVASPDPKPNPAHHARPVPDSHGEDHHEGHHERDVSDSHGEDHHEGHHEDHGVS